MNVETKHEPGFELEQGTDLIVVRAQRPGIPRNRVVALHSSTRLAIEHAVGRDSKGHVALVEVSLLLPTTGDG
ncbi:hypothetical protein [Nocardia sp. bgisy118]|uniref:hypothetical protein n=1 Tax=Nocardia sp. bgisy118 TaxID=3413786 RepID=UPI003F4A6576